MLSYTQDGKSRVALNATASVNNYREDNSLCSRSNNELTRNQKQIFKTNHNTIDLLVKCFVFKLISIFVDCNTVC